MNIQLFLTGLLAVSLFTTLTVQGIKLILKDFKKEVPHNTTAAITSVILSAGVSVGYALVNGIPFTVSYLVCSVALAFLSFLCATNGYDKVKQAIDQLISK